MKGIIAALSILWQNHLSSQERDSWETYAANISWTNRLAQGVKLTGFNHYVRSNAPRLQAGVTRRDAGPTQFNVAAPEQELSFANDIGHTFLIVSFDNVGPAWCTEPNAHQLVWMGRPTNPSQKFYGGPWRYIGRMNGIAPGPPPSPSLIAPAYPFFDDQLLRIRTRISRANGRLSEFAYAEHVAAGDIPTPQPQPEPEVTPYG